MADKPNISKEGYVAQLVRVGVWATPNNPIQYAFLEQKPAYLPNEPGWTAFSGAQRAAAQRAFAAIAEVVNLTFVQVADNQQQPGPANPRINFYANSVSLAFSGSMDAYQLDGSSAIHGADIRLNTARIAQRQSNEGWLDFTSFVALHEALHAVGLSHPGDYNGQGPTYQNDAEFVEDTIQYSVMSYFSAANTGADHFIGSVQYPARTPLLYDILALQSLYSPNMTTRAGDTVYGFNSNTGANSPFNFAVTPGPVVAIWDAGGIDTLDLSGYSDGSLIDLNEGAFSDAGGLTKNIAIAFNTTIENAVGGPGGDRLIGNAAANRLDGGAGADWMEGGPGDDVYVVDDPGDVVVDLPGAGRDEVRTALATYVLPGNVEVLTGTSPSAQTLIGNAWANTLSGGAGDDTLAGGASDDALEGGGGNGDTAVYAGNFADYEIGTAGQITIRDLNAADGDEGTDSLSGIELARFADRVVQLGVDTNNPPVLGDPDMVDQVWADGQAATYTIPATSFIDPDGPHALTFRATLADGSALPAWLSFDASTRTFSGTPPLTSVGATLTVRVTADDGKAPPIFDDFTIDVTQSPGADVVGTIGADLLDGTFRAERMIGNDGDDVLRGSPGADILHGEAGTDEADYSASPEGVTIDLVTGFGSGGHAEGDRLFAIEGVTGSSHADRITGSAGQDRLDGGAGNDLLDGGGESDTMEGGAGDDLYLVDNRFDLVVERANEGTDEVRTSLASYVLTADVEWITGLSGTGQALSGNALANVIVAGAGADRLDGGGGADSLAGGLGNDIYIVEEAGDAVTEAANAGIDEVRTSLAAYALTAEVENLVGLSAAGQALTGNGLANVITGGGGNDTLDGGAGADQLAGGLGDDTYIVDAGDAVVEAANAGMDEVRTALAAYILIADVEKLTGTSATGQALTGNGSANEIRGSTGADVLDGAAGADRMIGGAGDDLYFVDDGGDLVEEQASAGADEVRTALAAYSLAANVEVLTGTAATGQRLTGNALANVITGGGGADLLEGGGGDDRLDGGAGADTALYGSAGAGVTVSLALLGTPQNTGGAGTDTLVDVENLTGSPFGDVLIGNGSANLLDGLGGGDWMEGGGGNDVYFVDNPGDSITERANEGIDEVRTIFAAASLLGSHVENLTAASDVNHDFRGSAGNNAVRGGAGNDFIRLYDGGTDSGFGGAGNDVVLFGASMTWTDFVDGGAGLDQLALQGNYVGGSALLFGGGVVSIENIAILPGDDTRFGDPGTNFYDYKLTLQDSTVAAGVQMVIDANRLRVGEDLTFDGSAELDGGFFIYGGGGTDILFGGSNNDVFLFGAQGQWGAGDVVVGGSGLDQLALRGNYTLTFGAGQLFGIENIGLLSAHDTRFGALGSNYSYNLTLVDANVAAGVQMTVDGAKLRVSETFTFNGSAELDGSFRLFGGLVNDTLSGSQNGDLIQGNGGLDTLTGGGGADTFRYLASTDSATGAIDRILDFTPGTDKIDLTRIDANIHVAGDQAFAWIGSNAFTGSGAASAGELRAVQNGQSWFVEGDIDGNGAADFVVELNLAGPTPLGPGDFLL